MNSIDNNDDWFSQIVPSNFIDDDDWFSKLEPPKGPEDDDMVSIFDTGSSLIIDDETTFMIKRPSDIPVDDDDAQNSNLWKILMTVWVRQTRRMALKTRNIHQHLH